MTDLWKKLMMALATVAMMSGAPAYATDDEPAYEDPYKDYADPGDPSVDTGDLNWVSLKGWAGTEGNQAALALGEGGYVDTGAYQLGEGMTDIVINGSTCGGECADNSVLGSVVDWRSAGSYSTVTSAGEDGPFSSVAIGDSYIKSDAALKLQAGRVGGSWGSNGN